MHTTRLVRPMPARTPGIHLSLALCALVLAGCGSGGGGGGARDLVYEGNTAATVITAANATRLLGSVVSSSALSGEIPTGVATAGDARLPGPVRLVRLLRGVSARLRTDAAGTPSPALALRINETEQCFPTGSTQPSGSVRYSGTLSDADGTGTVTITFNNCTDGDTYLDGTVIWRIDETALSSSEPILLDMTFTFQRITLVSPEFNILLGGALREVVQDLEDTQTLDIVMRDRTTGRMQKTEGLVLVSAVESFPFAISEMVTGRLYDSIDGYVDIATPQKLMYEVIDDLYPASGQLLLTGAGGARLRATVAADAGVLIALDLDDDGVYEVEGSIPFEVIAVAGSDPADADGDGLPDAWEAGFGLSDATYADASADADADGLTNYEEFLLDTSPASDDSDGDGLPDGWEVGYGFDPLGAADAAQDFDGDTATNLQEFTRGTDPTDAFSTPADLAVSQTVSLATVSAQTLFEYRLTVTNLGPGLARGVTLTDTLPPGAEVYTVVPGVLPSAWDCGVGAGSLSCQPPGGTLAPGTPVTIAVPVIAPVASGVIGNSATVASATLDYEAANDTAAVDVTVAPAVLEQVDVAIDGAGGVDGLERPFRLAISPDGAHVYVPGIIDDAIAVFARDPVTGALSFVEAERAGLDTPDQADWPKAVAVSPDGNHVYVATEADGALLVYGRNGATGALTFIEKHVDGVAGVEGLASAIALAVSADGENVYVAGAGDDAVAVFARDTGTGQLTFSAAVVDGAGGVEGIKGAFDIALSPDDAFLYVAGASDNAIAVFSRDGGGALSYVGAVTGVHNPLSLGVSADGAYVYAIGGDAAQLTRGISAFSRDGATGALTLVATYSNGADGIMALDGMYNLAIAPDGGYVYVVSTSDSALGVFARDAGTGMLRFIEVQKDGIGASSGLGVAWALAVSPDSAFVYAAASGDNAVSAFSVDLGAVR